MSDTHQIQCRKVRVENWRKKIFKILKPNKTWKLKINEEEKRKEEKRREKKRREKRKEERAAQQQKREIMSRKAEEGDGSKDPNAEEDEGDFDFVKALDEAKSKPCAINDLVIVGNHKTKRKIIERELQQVKKAKNLEEILLTLNTALEELEALGIFKSVDATVRQRPTTQCEFFFFFFFFFVVIFNIFFLLLLSFFSRKSSVVICSSFRLTLDQFTFQTLQTSRSSWTRAQVMVCSRACSFKAARPLRRSRVP